MLLLSYLCKIVGMRRWIVLCVGMWLTLGFVVGCNKKTPQTVNTVDAMETLLSYVPEDTASLLIAPTAKDALAMIRELFLLSNALSGKSVQDLDDKFSKESGVSLLDPSSLQAAGVDTSRPVAWFELYGGNAWLVPYGKDDPKPLFDWYEKKIRGDTTVFLYKGMEAVVANGWLAIYDGTRPKQTHWFQAVFAKTNQGIASQPRYQKALAFAKAQEASLRDGGQNGEGGQAWVSFVDLRRVAPSCFDGLSEPILSTGLVTDRGLSAVSRVDMPTAISLALETVMSNPYAAWRQYAEDAPLRMRMDVDMHTLTEFFPQLLAKLLKNGSPKETSRSCDSLMASVIDGVRVPKGFPRAAYAAMKRFDPVKLSGDVLAHMDLVSSQSVEGLLSNIPQRKIFEKSVTVAGKPAVRFAFPGLFSAWYAFTEKQFVGALSKLVLESMLLSSRVKDDVFFEFRAKPSVIDNRSALLELLGLRENTAQKAGDFLGQYDEILLSAALTVSGGSFGEMRLRVARK